MNNIYTLEELKVLTTLYLTGLNRWDAEQNRASERFVAQVEIQSFHKWIEQKESEPAVHVYEGRNVYEIPQIKANIWTERGFIFLADDDLGFYKFNREINAAQQLSLLKTL